MEKLGGLVWPLTGCRERLSIPFETKGVLVDIKYLKEVTDVEKNGQMEVSFILTEQVRVLENGLVTLVSSTITLFSQRQTEGSECNWKLRGQGRESILGKN